MIGQEDIARLQDLSEDIKKDRIKGLPEMKRDDDIEPPTEDRRDCDQKKVHDQYGREVDKEYVEREVIYKGGRPPPGDLTADEKSVRPHLAERKLPRILANNLPGNPDNTQQSSDVLDEAERFQLY